MEKSDNVIKKYTIPTSKKVKAIIFMTIFMFVLVMSFIMISGRSGVSLIVYVVFIVFYIAETFIETSLYSDRIELKAPLIKKKIIFLDEGTFILKRYSGLWSIVQSITFKESAQINCKPNKGKPFAVINGLTELDEVEDLYKRIQELKGE